MTVNSHCSLNAASQQDDVCAELYNKKNHENFDLYKRLQREDIKTITNQIFVLYFSGATCCDYMIHISMGHSLWTVMGQWCTTHSFPFWAPPYLFLCHIHTQTLPLPGTRARSQSEWAFNRVSDMTTHSGNLGEVQLSHLHTQNTGHDSCSHEAVVRNTTHQGRHFWF